MEFRKWTWESCWLWHKRTYTIKICELRFNGRKWLGDPSLPSTNVEVEQIPLEEFFKEEKRKINIAVEQPINDSIQTDIFQKYSSWNKLKRVFAWCLKFINSCSKPPVSRENGFLTAEELSKAEKTIVKHVQQAHFCSKISCLSTEKQLSSSNRILSLAPFLDKFG